MKIPLRRALLLIGSCVVLALPGGADPGRPKLPETLYDYTDAGLPAHFTDPDAYLGNVADTDSTPDDNPITNEGATLGRVLFTPALSLSR